LAYNKYVKGYNIMDNMNGKWRGVELRGKLNARYEKYYSIFEIFGGIINRLTQRDK
jgi:hypothetical protein